MDEKVLPSLLIIEDLLNWRRLYRIWLKSISQITFSVNRTEALDAFQNSLYDVVIVDLGLPTPDVGLRTIKEIQSIRPNTKIIVVTSHIERELHLSVQKLGVYAVFEKDDRLESDLPVIVRKAFEMTLLERENSYLRHQVQKQIDAYQILGVSQAASALREKVKSISVADTPVLITGPTGAGKTYLAKLIHLSSPRSKKPFMILNCANLPQNLVESELFGHVKGAYTGANSTAPGKFQVSDGGSILLDEIGEIPVSIQAKLLQVIEDKTFYQLGGRNEISVDVRILASTNRNLKDALKNGNFREDLYYRLAGFSINIPPLSERKEDIPDYFDFFLEKACEDGALVKPEISPGFYDTLMDMPWRGNLRELKNVVDRLLLYHPATLESADLFQHFYSSKHEIVRNAIHKEYSLKELSCLYARELYRKLQSKKKVSKILGIDHKTLNKYLEMSVK